MPDTNFLKELVKAHNAASPYDSTDVELAAHWLSAGYDRMSAKEFTKAVNAVTGKNVSTTAMHTRRLNKLELMTVKRPGPKIKS